MIEQTAFEISQKKLVILGTITDLLVLLTELSLTKNNLFFGKVHTVRGGGVDKLYTTESVQYPSLKQCVCFLASTSDYFLFIAKWKPNWLPLQKKISRSLKTMLQNPLQLKQDDESLGGVISCQQRYAGVLNSFAFSFGLL